MAIVLVGRCLRTFPNELTHKRSVIPSLIGKNLKLCSSASKLSESDAIINNFKEEKNFMAKKDSRLIIYEKIDELLFYSKNLLR